MWESVKRYPAKNSKSNLLKFFLTYLVKNWLWSIIPVKVLGYFELAVLVVQTSTWVLASKIPRMSLLLTQLSQQFAMSERATIDINCLLCVLLLQALYKLAGRRKQNVLLHDVSKIVYSFAQLL